MLVCLYASASANVSVTSYEYVDMYEYVNVLVYVCVHAPPEANQAPSMQLPGAIPYAFAALYVDI